MRLQRNINQVAILGTVVDIPSFRTTPNGTSVCSFRMCTVRTFRTSFGEQKEEVEFHLITAWDKLAEICSKVIEKGTKVFINGRLKTNKFDEPDGKTRYSTEISAYDIVVVARPDEAIQDDTELNKIFSKEKES
jgi:single-strand DNA-binding protein